MPLCWLSVQDFGKVQLTQMLLVSGVGAVDHGDLRAAYPRGWRVRVALEWVESHAMQRGGGGAVHTDGEEERLGQRLVCVWE